MRRPWLIAAALLLPAFLSCEKKARVPQTTTGPKPPKLMFEGRDMLAVWTKRFEKRPKGSFDSPMPKLEKKDREEVTDRFYTALSTGRGMQRFAKQARQALLEKPEKAIAGLALYLEGPENGDDTKARALALFAGAPHPLLTSLCLQHLDDKSRLIRLECVRRLDESRSLGNIPRLLRRTREFYEEDPEILSAIYVALARLGNLSGLETLLVWLDRADLRPRAGTALISILPLFGPAYEESDGWGGLAKKGRGLLTSWKHDGQMPFVGEAPAWTEADHYLLDREFWLFLRHLAGKDLRVVDEARFIGQHAGTAMVPLVRDCLRDQRLRQRYHALEILIALGLPGNEAQREVLPLIDQPLTRSYALNAYGAIHGKGALTILLGVLRSDPALPDRQKDERIAALAGLSGLESPGAFEFLRKLFAREKDTELKAWTARAWIASAQGARAEARSYLQNLLDTKAFHEPTLLEMLRESDR